MSKLTKQEIAKANRVALAVRKAYQEMIKQKMRKIDGSLLKPLTRKDVELVKLSLVSGTRKFRQAKYKAFECNLFFVRAYRELLLTERANKS